MDTLKHDINKDFPTAMRGVDVIGEGEKTKVRVRLFPFSPSCAYFGPILAPKIVCCDYSNVNGVPWSCGVLRKCTFPSLTRRLTMAGCLIPTSVMGTPIARRRSATTVWRTGSRANWTGRPRTRCQVISLLSLKQIQYIRCESAEER